MVSKDNLGFFAAAPDVVAMHKPTMLAVESSDDIMTDIDIPEEPEPVVLKRIHYHEIFTPSVSEIESDSISKLAARNWASSGSKFKASLVEDIWTDEIQGPAFNGKKILLLEYSQYLERCRQKLADPWKAVSVDSEKFEALFNRVILTMDNTKLPDLRIRKLLLVFLINTFASLENPVIRSSAMNIVSASILACLYKLNFGEEYVKSNPILVKAFAKEEKKLVKAQSDAKKLSLLTLYRTFLSKQLDFFLKILKTIPAEGPMDTDALMYCERFLEFVTDLEAQLPTRRYFNQLLHDRLVVIVCDESKLATRGRKFLELNKNNLDDSSQSGLLFVQLLTRLQFYAQFEIDCFTGKELSVQEIESRHYLRIFGLQKRAFEKLPDVYEIRRFSLESIANVEKKDFWGPFCKSIYFVQIANFCDVSGICPRYEIDTQLETESHSMEVMSKALIFKYAKRSSQIDVINSTPLYPTESMLMNANSVPDTYFTNLHCMAIPKLNLQFLTIHDYLLRNFTLFQLESAYEIRSSIEEAVKRMAPRYLPSEDRTFFSGWSRMGLAIDKFSIITVGPPKLGDIKPAYVKADVTFNISNLPENLQKDWDSLRPMDCLFLLSVQRGTGKREFQDTPDRDLSSIQVLQKYGVQIIRGGEISALVENGRVVEEFNFTGAANALLLQKKQEVDNSYEKHRVHGGKRTYRLLLDSNQYIQDLVRHEKNGGTDVYTSNLLNMVIRRKPQENNFKAILETIRDLIRASEVVIPSWIHDVFLGYGDPAAASFNKMSANMVIRSFNFQHIFVDWQHLKESFPDHDVEGVDESGDIVESMEPPYIITFPRSMYSSLVNSENISATEIGQGIRHLIGNDAADELAGSNFSSIRVKSYPAAPEGPYPKVKAKRNTLRFTPTQAHAILAGSSPGLTMIVGPPGSGKTDVAVQIISNLYNDHPNQHTLIVTHSNQALNQLFEKIVGLNIDPRHLLRLGHGEDELEIQGSSGDWGKLGRVKYFLERRLELLAKVDKLADILNVPGAHGSNCETAWYFYRYHVADRMESFRALIGNGEGMARDAIIKAFPFTALFDDTETPIFASEKTVEQVYEMANQSLEYITNMFAELEQTRAFELLRTAKDRSNFLLVKEAKIIALTCTHAALKRRELLKLGFKYDNVIMEEAAQILEVEAFIPLLLQSPESMTSTSENSTSRLKRVVLIGDHHQLPPVVQNSAFLRYGNMEQSMFSRFVRLGTPLIQLDMQSRCRPELSELFKWNYDSLGDMEHVLPTSKMSGDAFNPFAHANAGFLFTHQLVDVPDFAGKGESEPVQHFIQNLGEAEYVVGVFMYMRLLGFVSRSSYFEFPRYPADKITILSTYNGQKDLILDVLEQRCAWNPLLGRPGSVSTVDKYQGQQNDYILLSLVRTKTVGHLRDVRRLIVALSRARLGLYVFCRSQVFLNCPELRPAFDILMRNRMGDSDGLALVKGELFGERIEIDRGIAGIITKPKKKRKSDASAVISPAYTVDGVEHMGRHVHEMLQKQIAWLKKEKDLGNIADI